MILFWIILLIASLAILVKSADYFVEAAEKIGIHIGLSPFVVGVTIVAIGTSLPELASSIAAVLQGSTEFVIGNVVGSNITNILLVFGLVAFFGKSFRLKGVGKVDLPFFLISIVILLLFSLSGTFGLYGAVVSLVGIGIYLYIKLNKKARNIKKDLIADYKDWIVLAVTSAFIWLGSKYTVFSVIELSNQLGLGAEVLSATVVALGTSLPELMVSIISLRRSQFQIAAGNILGSNIFNTFAVMGIPALFTSIIIPRSIFVLGFPIMFLASLFFYMIIRRGHVERMHGVILLAAYVAFVLLFFIV